MTGVTGRTVKIVADDRPSALRKWVISADITPADWNLRVSQMTSIPSEHRLLLYKPSGGGSNGGLSSSTVSVAGATATEIRTIDELRHLFAVVTGPINKLVITDTRKSTSPVATATAAAAAAAVVVVGNKLERKQAMPPPQPQTQQSAQQKSGTFPLPTDWVWAMPSSSSSMNGNSTADGLGSNGQGNGASHDHTNRERLAVAACLAAGNANRVLNLILIRSYEHELDPKHQINRALTDLARYSKSNPIHTY